MTPRNTPSRPSTRVTARRCSTTCTSPLPTGGVASARIPRSTITMYPDTNIIKTRTVGFPFGFNSGDSIEQSTDTLRLCAERQMADQRQLHAGRRTCRSRTARSTPTSSPCAPSACRRRSRSTSTPAMAFRPGTSMMTPRCSIRRCGTSASCSRTAAGPGRRRHRRRSMATTSSARRRCFKKLSFGVRYDDRERVQSQPATDRPPFLGRPCLGHMPEGMVRTQRRLLRTARPTYRPAGWWPMATTSRTTRTKCARCTASRRRSAAASFLRRRTRRRRPLTCRRTCELGEKFFAKVGVRYVDVYTPIEFTDVVGPGQPNPADEQRRRLHAVGHLRYEFTDDFRAARQLRRDAASSGTSAT